MDFVLLYCLFKVQHSLLPFLFHPSGRMMQWRGYFISLIDCLDLTFLKCAGNLILATQYVNATVKIAFVPEVSMRMEGVCMQAGT